MATRNKEYWPALLTGTIVQHSEAQAVWIDPREREQQYLSVLSKMVNVRTDVGPVLFCENSSANMDLFNSLFSIYAKNCRTFQMYKVPMPESEFFFGKGWGEGIIIRWALENIAILSDSKGFLKITGRYHVVNLKRILSIIRRGLAKNPDIKFVCQSLSITDKPHIQTAFFWSDTNFFRDNMLDVYEKVRDEQGVFLEHVFADRLIQLKNRFDFSILPIPLIVKGVNGWNATQIMSNRNILKQELKQKLFPLPDLISFREYYNANIKLPNPDI